MVRLFIGFISIFACSIIGKEITDKFRLKANYYERVREFNLKLKQNLLYRCDSLLNLVDYRTKNEHFNQTLQSYKLYLFTQGNIDDLYMPQFLDEEDRQNLLSYFLQIGKGNTISELEFIEYFDGELIEKLSKIRDKSNKFSNLGQKLGFSFGLGIFILIL